MIGLMAEQGTITSMAALATIHIIFALTMEAMTIFSIQTERVP